MSKANIRFCGPCPFHGTSEPPSKHGFGLESTWQHHAWPPHLLPGQGDEGGLDDASAQAQDQMEGGLCKTEGRSHDPVPAAMR